MSTVVGQVIESYEIPKTREYSEDGTTWRFLGAWISRKNQRGLEAKIFFPNYVKSFSFAENHTVAYIEGVIMQYCGNVEQFAGPEQIKEKEIARKIIHIIEASHFELKG